jgi:acetyl-CoA C-acetyltransferase
MPAFLLKRPPYSINQLCGPGLRTVVLGYQAIRTGNADIVVASGQESMSQAPHAMHLCNGVKMGDAQLIDTMIRNGLWDAFHGYHMGTTAENVAKKWQTSVSCRANSPPRRRTRPKRS